MFTFNVKTQYVIKNNKGYMIGTSMNTEASAITEASYLDILSPDLAPHQVFRQDTTMTEVRINPTSKDD